MNNFKKLLVGSVVTIAVVGLGTPITAQASPGRAQLKAAKHAKPADCHDPAYGPSTVNVGLSSVVKTFSVTADCDGGLSGWSLETSIFYVYDGAPDNTFHPYDLSDSEAGSYDITATTDDGEFNQNEFLGTFNLKRYSTWGNTFNASPEPVKKGSTINFYGELLRANWDQGKYYGYGNGYTHLDFRPAGDPTWRTVKTFRTSSSYVGHITNLTTVATVSGFWRVYYTGNDYGSPAYSTTDYVGVS
jgi:hypothetical protein